MAASGQRVNSAAAQLNHHNFDNQSISRASMQTVNTSIEFSGFGHYWCLKLAVFTCWLLATLTLQFWQLQGVSSSNLNFLTFGTTTAMPEVLQFNSSPQGALMVPNQPIAPNDLRNPGLGNLS